MNGDAISNIAGIYFDFNDPVITNLVSTDVGKPSNTQDHLSKENLTIVPNPATHTIQVVSDILSNQWDDLTIFDMNGRVVSKLKVNINNTLFDISHLVSGAYTIMLRTDRGTTHRSRLIKI